MQQQQKTEITKNKIMTAAENEFAEKGLYGARVDSIAENANVNKRMIYQHFESKEGLYTAVLLNVYRRISEREVSAFGSDLSDPVLAIRRLVREYFDFLKNDENFVRIIMWENLNNAEYLKKTDVASVKAPFVKAVLETLKKGQKIGVFKDNISEKQVMLSLIGGAFSYFSNIHTLSAVLDFDMTNDANISERAELVADSVLREICAKDC